MLRRQRHFRPSSRGDESLRCAPPQLASEGTAGAGPIEWRSSERRTSPPPLERAAPPDVLSAPRVIACLFGPITVGGWDHEQTSISQCSVLFGGFLENHTLGPELEPPPSSRSERTAGQPHRAHRGHTRQRNGVPCAGRRACGDLTWPIDRQRDDRHSEWHDPIRRTRRLRSGGGPSLGFGRPHSLRGLH